VNRLVSGLDFSRAAKSKEMNETLALRDGQSAALSSRVKSRELQMPFAKKD
jgi:hypothetical protein